MVCWDRTWSAPPGRRTWPLRELGGGRVARRRFASRATLSAVNMDEIFKLVLENGLGAGLLLFGFYFVGRGYPEWRKIEHKHQLEIAALAEVARKDFLGELAANRAAMAEMTRAVLQLATENRR